MSAKIDRVPVVINPNLVHGDLLFATGRDRGLYIGTSISDQPRWLEEHAGSWWRIADVQREAAAPLPPAEGETIVAAEPPAPKQPPDKAAMREGVRSQTEATPLQSLGRKRGRSGGRRPKKQKLPAEISKVGRKRTPACMVRFLDILAEYRVLSVPQLAEQAFTPKRLRIGASAARPVTPVTTSSGAAKRGDFTNIVNRRLRRPRIYPSMRRTTWQWAVWSTSTTRFSCRAIV